MPLMIYHGFLQQRLNDLAAWRTLYATLIVNYQAWGSVVENMDTAV